MPVIRNRAGSGFLAWTMGTLKHRDGSRRRSVGRSSQLCHCKATRSHHGWASVAKLLCRPVLETIDKEEAVCGVILVGQFHLPKAQRDDA